MVARCANASCSSRFHYLHEGKLFRFQFESAQPNNYPRKTEYFWLCDQCAVKMIVRVENGKAVTAPVATVERKQPGNLWGSPLSEAS